MLNLSKFINPKLKGPFPKQFLAYLATNSTKQLHDLHGNVRYLLPIIRDSSCNRGFKSWSPLFSEETAIVESNEDEEKKPVIDPRKDRTKIISPETSIRYMKSAAYKTTYGDEPVWVKYRRNFKGQFVPRKTRETCIISGMIATGSPCPICRDEYLVLDYRNVDLLKQFIDPHTGQVYDSRKIHLCQKKLLQLEVALKKAKFYGLITYQVPFRNYDYKDYYANYEA